MALTPFFDRSLSFPFTTSIYDPIFDVDRFFDSFLDNDRRLRLRENAARMRLTDKGDFTYSINVDGFNPNELKVDIEGDDLVVEGDHKEVHNGEFIHRQFSRRVRIPDGINKESIRCDIDSRGRLEIAGKKSALTIGQKRNLPIGFKGGQSQQKGQVPIEDRKNASQEVESTPAKRGRRGKAK